MIHRALITFLILLFVPSWHAAALAQGNAVFTKEQSVRLTPGFAKQCAAEIAGVMSYALRNGMPSAAKMGDLDYWVGFPKGRVQSAYNIARPGFEEDKTEYWRPINRYFYCQAGYVLAHWDDAASGNRSTTRPNTAVKPAPKAAALAKKLPPARPAKMLQWSPKAMSTEQGLPLSPRFAAERADALASCSVSVQQFSGYAGKPIADTNLVNEQYLLNDSQIMTSSVEQVRKKLANIENYIARNKLSPVDLAAYQIGRCLYQRRIAQIEGSPLIAGAVDGSLTPLSIGGKTPPWTQQGKDARIIASDGESAMGCVKLVELAKSNSGVSGGGRVLSNQCSGPVEIVWCMSPGGCERKIGNGWTVSAGGSWPVSSEGTVRWAACRGANTAAFVKDSYGLRYYCTAPAKK